MNHYDLARPIPLTTDSKPRAGASTAGAAYALPWATMLCPLGAIVSSVPPETNVTPSAAFIIFVVRLSDSYSSTRRYPRTQPREPWGGIRSAAWLSSDSVKATANGNLPIGAPLV